MRVKDIQDDYARFCRSSKHGRPSVKKEVFDYLSDRLNRDESFTARTIASYLNSKEAKNAISKRSVILPDQVTTAFKQIRADLLKPDWPHRHIQLIQENRLWRLINRRSEFETADLFDRLSSPSESLRDPSLLAWLGSPIVIFDEAFLEERFGESASGLFPEQIRVTMTGTNRVLPAPAAGWKAASDEPKDNRTKVYLAGWSYPVSDRESDEGLSLSLGNSDYWSGEAVRNTTTQIHRLVGQGDLLNLSDLHRQLNCNVLVLTSDEKVLLGQRNTTADSVGEIRPGEWGVTLGESVDGKLDALGEVLGQPIDLGKTVRRALKEELGVRLDDTLTLSNDPRRRAELRFMGLTTEWDHLTSVLLVTVRLPIEAGDVSYLWRGVSRDRREILRLDPIDFLPGRCASLLVTGRHPNDPSGANKIYGTARIAILLALLSSFGDEAKVAIEKQLAES